MDSKSKSGSASNALGEGGEIWDELCWSLHDSLRLLREADGSTPDADLGEGLRYLTRLLAGGIVVCVEHADPDYPEFGRMLDHTMKWGLDAPDCLYSYATIRGDARYRISGTRGSANHIDFQVNYGHFASGDIASWGTIASINGTELEVADDGSFELFLSPERESGNALRLAPEAEFVLVRQYFDDWDAEQPADIAIERVGATYPAPTPSTEQIAARLDRLTSWLRKSGVLWKEMSEGLLALPDNTVIAHRPEDSDQRAGMRGQAYVMGNFACEPGQAVVVELEPPACRHWSLSLANRYWESLDFATRQTSLNRHQATLDADGMFRAVVAHEDPGVPNWLDTAGNTRGTIAIRFLLAEATPDVSMRRLSSADIRAALPDATPFVTPAERAATLDRRRRAILRRYRR